MVCNYVKHSVVSKGRPNSTINDFNVTRITTLLTESCVQDQFRGY